MVQGDSPPLHFLLLKWSRACKLPNGFGLMRAEDEQTLQTMALHLKKKKVFLF